MMHEFVLRTEPGDIRSTHPGVETDCPICAPGAPHRMVMEHGQGIQCKCKCGWESGRFCSVGSAAAKDWATHEGQIFDHTIQKRWAAASFDPKREKAVPDMGGRCACSNCGWRLSQNPASEDQVSGLCAYCLNGPFVPPGYSPPPGVCQHAELVAQCDRCAVMS